MFKRELRSRLKLSAIFKPLNTGSRFGSYIKFEFHIRASLVLDLIKILLRYFNLWGTWTRDGKTSQDVEYVGCGINILEYKTMHNCRKKYTNITQHEKTYHKCPHMWLAPQ